MPYEYWILLGISFLGSWLTTPLFQRLAVRLQITDQPSARKVHTKPVPYLGGMAFLVSMSLGMIYLIWFCPHVLSMQETPTKLFSLFVVACLFQLLGVIDDIHPVKPSIKLLIQAVLSGVLVQQGFLIEQMTSPFGGVIPLGWFGALISVLWILTIVNAINFIDGLDGLAAGVVFFAALANLFIALDPWQNFVCIVSLVLMGATLGFIPYNFSPAKIFMGDAGSLFLGVLIAGSALVSSVKTPTMMSLSLPLVILSLPLIDILLTVIRRGKRGQRFFSADREHLHHRFMRLGFRDREVVLCIYGLCFFLSMSAILAAQLPDRYAFVFVIVYIGWIFWALIVFNALEKRIILQENDTTASSLENGNQA